MSTDAIMSALKKNNAFKQLACKATATLIKASEINDTSNLDAYRGYYVFSDDPKCFQSRVEIDRYFLFLQNASAHVASLQYKNQQ